MRKTTILLAGAFAVSLAGVAVAQLVPTSQLNSQVYTDDLVQVITHSVPTSSGRYVRPKQLTAQFGYYRGAPTASFSLTLDDNATRMLLKPNGTITTGYVTFNPNPNDGQEDCLYSTQAITNFYPTANTGQSVDSAVTTLAANASACYLYQLSSATWYRSR